MLVTQAEEIRAYLPTSAYGSPEGLLSFMEEAEESHLVPILGRSLYDKVVKIYETLLENHGGVVSPFVPKEEVDDEVRLVRLCQLPVVYYSLADSTGLLAVSLNNGGGFNQMSTDTYEPADENAIKRFERDAFFKARRGIDRLLVFLEEDARKPEPLFAEAWKESGYFYRQGDLLFTTALEMNRFIDIKASRLEFIGLLPDIRFCQKTYLEPEIGIGLIKAIISSQTDSSVIPTDTPDVEGREANTATWNEATELLRMALALFVEARKPEKQRKYSENEAYYSLYKARDFMAARQDAFRQWIKDSPLYVPPESGKAEAPARPCAERMNTFDPDASDNAIFVLRGINRH